MDISLWDEVVFLAYYSYWKGFLKIFSVNVNKLAIFYDETLLRK